jgi:hypothetical protein
MSQSVVADPQGGLPGPDQQAGQAQPAQPGAPWRVARQRALAVARHPAVVHLTVLVGFLAAGIAITWPRATYLTDGKVSANLDASGYVWDLWWMAHCVQHLTDPWTTSYLAAPVGTMLGLHTLMPLPGALMTPITATWGPSVSYNLLVIASPGLLAYVMYRVARLWLPGQAGPLAAGGLFGFSAIMTWQYWMHLNLALAALFLPMTLEAVVRLRRHPGFRQALVLGLVLGGCMLTDQETAIMAVMLAVVALVPWLVRRPWLRRLAVVGVATMTALVVASPQLLAIAHETKYGGPQPQPSVGQYWGGVRIPNIFEPSPRLAAFGWHLGQAHEWSTYGIVLSVLGLIGLVLAVVSRRRGAILLGLLWLGATVMAFGAVFHLGHRVFVPWAHWWDGVPVSYLMPFTWFVKIPGLSSFREPSRMAELGLVAAALLAGYAVTWVRVHVREWRWFPASRVIVAVVFALGLGEAGMGLAPVGTMPAALPALDGPIAADHSHSVVVDIPYGLRGGVGITGEAFNVQTLMLATQDGHPLGDAYLSRVPAVTAADIGIEPFYSDLISAQEGHYQFTHAEVKMAADNAASMHIGWILLWVPNIHLEKYLTSTGFRFDYQADGAMVYRPASDVPVTTHQPSTDADVTRR